MTTVSVAQPPVSPETPHPRIQCSAADAGAAQRRLQDGSQRQALPATDGRHRPPAALSLTQEPEAQARSLN